MKRFLAILIFVGAAFVCLPLSVGAELPDLLSPDACGENWKRDGKVLSFDRRNLFDHINGEAELYFPYGFRTLVTALYQNKANPDASIVVDLYEMGSPLDAFGIYSNYRKTDDKPLSSEAGIGTEGFISPSQLMFYQGAYFVRIQASGSTGLYREAFLRCGRELSRKLPPDRGRPHILDVLRIPEIVPGSERYIAQSLLGYEFFNRGLMAAAGRGWMQVFIVITDSPENARTTLDRYRSYLKESGGKMIKTTGKAGQPAMSAVDPLYGNVSVTQTGRYLIGAVKIKEPVRARRILESLRTKLNNLQMDVSRLM